MVRVSNAKGFVYCFRLKNAPLRMAHDLSLSVMMTYVDRNQIMIGF